MERGDVICSFYKPNSSVSAKSFHCHHTVGISVNWRKSDDEQKGLFLPLITSAEHNPSEAYHLIDNIIYNQAEYKETPIYAAAMYGYNDPNYVSRLYKRLFGHNITDKRFIHPEIK